MKNWYNITYILILVHLLASGQDSTKTDNDFFDLSIEELMNVSVSTAKGNKERIESAPAIIDVIEKHQLLEFDVTNLYEVISLLPGVEMIETYSGRTVLNFRGIQNMAYNNKVLLLINGAPVFDPVHGNSFLEAIPIYSIHRIEIIRGPASSLYGSNAYGGVINVITEADIKENQVLTYLSVDASLSTSVGVNISTMLGEKVGLSLSGESYNSGGNTFDLIADENGRSGSFDDFSNIDRLLMRLEYGNLSLDAGLMDAKRFNMGIVPKLGNRGEVHHQQYFANIHYWKNITNSLRFNSLLRHNKYNNPKTTMRRLPEMPEVSETKGSVWGEVAGYNDGAQMSFDYDWKEKLQVSFGGLFEYQNSDDYTYYWEVDSTIHAGSPYTQVNNTTLSLFSQAYYKANKRIEIGGGFRQVMDSYLSKDIFLPRASFYYKLSEKISLKMLGGKSYRLPSFYEKYAETYQVIKGNSELKEEELSSLEFALNYKQCKCLKLRANVFYMQTKDGISTIPTTDPTNDGPAAHEYVNIGSITSRGLELEAEGAIELPFLGGLKGYYGLNYTFVDGLDTQTNAHLLGTAEQMANGWIRVGGKQFFVTSSLQVVGNRKGYSKRLIDHEEEVGFYTIPAYSLLNITLGYNVNKIQMTTGLRNVLDVAYSYPEYVRGRMESIPGGQGISAYFSIKYNLSVKE